MDGQQSKEWNPTVPAELLHDKRLSPRDKEVALKIETYARGYRTAYPTNNQIGRLLGCHGRTVQRSIANLERCGWVRQQVAPEFKRGYLIVCEWNHRERPRGPVSTPDKSVRGARHSCLGGPDKSVRGPQTNLSPELSEEKKTEPKNVTLRDGTVFSSSDSKTEDRPSSPAPEAAKLEPTKDPEPLNLNQAIRDLGPDTDPKVVSWIAKCVADDLLDSHSVAFHERIVRQVAAGEITKERYFAAFRRGKQMVGKVKKPVHTFKKELEEYIPRKSDAQVAKERVSAPSVAPAVKHDPAPRYDYWNEEPWPNGQAVSSLKPLVGPSRKAPPVDEAEREKLLASLKADLERREAKRVLNPAAESPDVDQAERVKIYKRQLSELLALSASKLRARLDADHERFFSRVLSVNGRPKTTLPLTTCPPIPCLESIGWALGRAVEQTPKALASPPSAPSLPSLGSVGQPVEPKRKRTPDERRREWEDHLAAKRNAPPAT